MSDPLFLDELDPKDRQDRAARRSLLIKVFVFSAALAIIIYSIWYFYPSSDDTAPLPVIYADATPIRMEPEDEGGMEIAHQDSTIYNTFTSDRDNSSYTPKVENLIDSPSAEKGETPIPKEKLFAGLKPAIDEPAQMETPETPEDTQATPPADIDIKFKNSFEPTKSETVAKAAPEKTPQNLMSPSSEQEEQPSSLAKAPTPSPVAAPSPSPATENANDPAKAFYVQLASIQDESKTTKAWQDLQQKYGDLLSSVTYRTQKTDIAGKGTFYRIQGGPLTRDAANTLCENIKSKSGGCFVVAN